MGYLFLWVIFGAAAYSVANSKGRNKFFWFAMGLLIGPFAALILVFLPTGPEGDQDYQ